jgi:hypothetical protein
MNLRVVLGVVYGGILLFGAFASLEHDPSIGLPALLVAAPMSFVPIVGFFAIPVWWGVAGWLSGRPGRLAFTIFMVVHTASVLTFWIFFVGVRFDLIARVPRLYFTNLALRFPSVMWRTLGIYAAGQIVAWISVFTPRPAPPSPRRPAP